ncbi:hypothetical protein [Rhizobium mongolense]
MKIKITAGGIYGGDGKEVPIGTELTVKEEPKGWAGRYTVLSGDAKGKTAVTNPNEDEAKTPAEVLAMASNPDVAFMTFKSAATKLLGEKTPSTKADIVTALEDLATKP